LLDKDRFGIFVLLINFGRLLINLKSWSKNANHYKKCIFIADVKAVSLICKKKQSVGVGVKFKALPNTLSVISAVVHTTNNLIDTDKQTVQENTHTEYSSKYSKRKIPASVASYDTRPGNEMGLFNNSPELTWVEKSTSKN